MEAVPEHCPGVQSENAGKAANCRGCPNQQICESGSAAQNNANTELIKAKLSSIKHKFLVLSGKGGVGKSTFTSLLARYLADVNKEENVAILDVDICGPSIPRLMGVLNEKIHQSGSGWSPVFVDDNLFVMSIGFLLESSDDAVIWRGPKKNGMIQQFFTEVDWGDMVQYLVIDTPPGTSDEHLSIAQFLKEIPNVSAIVVTTPQEVSLLDVRKEIDFLRKVNIPILGVVENMSPFVCPHCKTHSEIFPASSGGAQQMSAELKVPFLGSVPLDPSVTRACDEGVNPLESISGTAFHASLKSIVSNILNQLS